MTAPQGKVVRVYAPVREQIVELIREGILHGRFAPGQRLVERELCAEFGVSRNPLREAYRQLEAEGWIKITTHRGPTVATVSDDEARELYEVREAIECLAVRLFVERADDAELARLQTVHAELRTAHREGDVPTMLETKQRFYDALYDGAGNTVLRSQAALLQNRLFLLRQRSLASTGRAKSSISEINAVMKKVVARDAAAAARQWGEHIHSAARAALQAPGRTGNGGQGAEASA